jgi:hypothetical protein
MTVLTPMAFGDMGQSSAFMVSRVIRQHSGLLDYPSFTLRDGSSSAATSGRLCQGKQHAPTIMLFCSNFNGTWISTSMLSDGNLNGLDLFWYSTKIHNPS